MKTHSQKKWVFRFSLGGYLGMGVGSQECGISQSDFHGLSLF